MCGVWFAVFECVWFAVFECVWFAVFECVWVAVLECVWVAVLDVRSSCGFRRAFEPPRSVHSVSRLPTCARGDRELGELVRPRGATMFGDVLALCSSL
jgi:hypothetical protein